VQGGMPVPVNEAGVHLEIFEKFEHGNATFIAVHPCSLVPGIAAPLVEAVGVTAQRQVTAYLDTAHPRGEQEGRVAAGRGDGICADTACLY